MSTLHLRARIDEQIANLTARVDGEDDALLTGAIAVLRECAALLCPRCGHPDTNKHDQPCLVCGQSRCTHGPKGLCPWREQIQRYDFLAGYALRDDLEQQELERLSAELQGGGLLPEWEVVKRRPVAEILAPSPRPSARRKK